MRVFGQRRFGTIVLSMGMAFFADSNALFGSGMGICFFQKVSWVHILHLPTLQLICQLSLFINLLSHNSGLGSGVI